ncbi:MAG: ABC transporter substrate-binding protein [bacterium]
MNRFFRVFISLTLIFSLVLSLNLVGFSQKKYNESPMLAELVKQGKLPPVEKRLPENPLVVEPVEEIGKYGGTWRFAMLGPGDISIYVPIFAEPLVKWNRSGNGIIPNVTEKWEVKRAYKEFVFYLRKGLKWSDGQPLTADDIMFWYEDILQNKELAPSFPSWLVVADTPVVVKKINDYTVSFTFKEPNVVFLENVCFQGGGGSGTLSIMIHPKHYLKQFHPKYTPKEQLEKTAKEMGFSTWYSLFWNRADFYTNPDCPVISAWKVTTPLAGKSVHVLERNPYYWKVDPAGNQLPYIDRIAASVVENAEVVNIKALSGELDFQFKHIILNNYPLLKENEVKGGYNVLLWPTALGSNCAFMPNLNHKDPVLKALFNNRNFRIGLSYAINRDEINKLCYLGLAQPRQATVVPECPYYTPGLEKLYAEYDPKKANEYLDKAGLNRRDKDGYRLRPDGKPLQLTIEFTPSGEFGPWPDVVELVTKYWNAVGLKVAYKSMDRALFDIRRASTEFDIMVWAWGRGLTPLIQPVFIFPVITTTGAPLYAQWYSSRGKTGEKPTGDILRAMYMYDRFKRTIDDAERIKIGKELIKLSAENVWSIGTVGLAPTPLVVRKNFRNVPQRSFYEWLLLQISNTSPEQYFIKD